MGQIAADSAGVNGVGGRVREGEAMSNAAALLLLSTTSALPFIHPQRWPVNWTALYGVEWR